MSQISEEAIAYTRAAIEGEGFERIAEARE
jgi:hypothetical protein